MPIHYKSTKWAMKDFGPSLTEQEHKDSCDINKMVRSAKRGMQVRGSGNPVRYGFDDMTLDSVQFRISKQQAEEDMDEIIGNSELTDGDVETLKRVAPGVAKKYESKIKRKKVDGSLHTTPPINEAKSNNQKPEESKSGPSGVPSGG